MFIVSILLFVGGMFVLGISFSLADLQALVFIVGLLLWSSSDSPSRCTWQRHASRHLEFLSATSRRSTRDQRATAPYSGPGAASMRVSAAARA